jgi:Sec-independent protein translocase protein TatA
LHPFPLIEAFWASLDSERPSGDDPKRVALALSQFYTDLKKHVDKSRSVRWKTPLFKTSDPEIRSNLKNIESLLNEILPTLPGPDPSKLEELRQLDETLRRSTFALEQEERQTDLPSFESPKLNQFNYLYEGWRRGLLPVDPIKGFLEEYRQAVRQTAKEVEEAQKTVNPRESEEEKAAVERAVDSIAALRKGLSELASTLGSGAEKCQPVVSRILQTGKTLGSVFHALEECAPLKDPCPFCGGQLSLSGRCRSCGRRLPHLEEAQSDDPDITSEFLSNNCRAVDLALLRWEAEPENEELWRGFQEAVREFGKHVVTGRKSLEMLEMAADRPIDSQSEMRKKEASLKKVADEFQSALTLLSKFSQSAQPPATTLDGAWREPLKTAEEKLQELSAAPQVE